MTRAHYYICKHCDEVAIDHVDGKCLFHSTSFEPVTEVVFDGDKRTTRIAVRLKMDGDIYRNYWLSKQQGPSEWRPVVFWGVIGVICLILAEWFK